MGRVERIAGVRRVNAKYKTTTSIIIYIYIYCIITWLFYFRDLHKTPNVREVWLVERKGSTVMFSQTYWLNITSMRVAVFLLSVGCAHSDYQCVSKKKFSYEIDVTEKGENLGINPNICCVWFWRKYFWFNTPYLSVSVTAARNVREFLTFDDSFNLKKMVAYQIKKPIVENRQQVFARTNIEP